MYVADTGNDRIQKFDSEGKFLAKWGYRGPANGQFRQPSDIHVDNNGNVYVADTYNDRILQFYPYGRFLAKWVSFGSADGQFRKPVAMTMDNAGDVFLADGTHRVQKVRLLP